MLYRPSSFRKSAIALTTVAALADASVLANFSANAQQAVSYSATPDCATIADGGKRAACEFFKKVENAKKRGAVADEAIRCLTDLGKFKEKNPDGFAKLGTITRESACDAAARIRPTASLN